MEAITGRVWKFGDDINTDIIFPGKYTYSVTEPEEMAKHAMEDVDPTFNQKVRKGDIIVVGKNFGCGSSREQAVLCLKAAGISAIVAKSFARIYFRNAINLGLPIAVCPELVDEIKQGNELTLKLAIGQIKYKEKIYNFPPLPAEVREILDKGGLVPYVKSKLR